MVYYPNFGLKIRTGWVRVAAPLLVTDAFFRAEREGRLLDQELHSSPPADLLLAGNPGVVWAYGRRQGRLADVRRCERDGVAGRSPPATLRMGTSFLRHRDSETLFQVLAILLAVALLAALGWWREAGFNRLSRWRNLHLLWFPLLVGTLSLLGGVEVTEPALFVPAMLG